MAEPANERSSLVAMTAGIVSAYVGANSIRAADLPDLIGTIHAALSNAGGPAPPPEPIKPIPPVPIRKSVTPDYLISLEDGKRYKSLARHLGGRGLTPSDYRAKWGLPSDYPMTAPAYSARRSEIAKLLGLGRRRSEASANTGATEGAESEVEPAVQVTTIAAPKRASRRKKVGAPAGA